MTVTVDAEVYDGLQAAIQADNVNEYHHTHTQIWLFKKGHIQAGLWIGKNHAEYGRGLQDGFAAQGELHEASMD